MTLAMFGGDPIRKHPWPKWPRADQNTEANIMDVLRSSRWAISGVYDGRKSYERRFAEAFAAFNGTRHCVPVANGSSALSVALEALGVGYGDEVLVPGLTWVACASSVAALGAVPVLVDIDADTLCMSVEAAREAITSRTKVIMVVHLYCSVADVDGFLSLSQETGIPLLEDCSQAHGAIWRGKRVGTFGRVGTFSMQQTKVLTSGEGGATITDDHEVCSLMQQLRADGRRYAETTPPVGRMELEEVGHIQGRNRCLSEFQAAVLLDRLGHVDEENRAREKNAALLSSYLGVLGNFRPPLRYPKVERITHYHYCIKLDWCVLGSVAVETIAKALTAELGILVEPLDDPLNRNVLYNPLRSRRTPAISSDREQLNPARFALPEAARVRKDHLLLPQNVLLGDEEDLNDIVQAFKKLIDQRDALRKLSSG